MDNYKLVDGLIIAAVTVTFAVIIPAFSGAFWHWYYARKRNVGEIKVKAKIEELRKAGDTAAIPIIK